MRKNAKKFITLVCNKCGSEIKKERKEYDRQIKRGQSKFYCDLKCLGRCLVKADSPFSFMHCSSRKSARSRELEFNITIQDLKAQWLRQDGKCPYTSVKMKMPTWGASNSPPDSASIDRIDSSRGYTPDNIEFVCMFVNLGKRQFTKPQIQEFISRCNFFVQTGISEPNTL